MGRRLERPGDPPFAPIEPAGDATHARLMALLEQPAYESWRWHDEDMEGADLPRPTAPDDSDWLDAIMQETDGFAPRVVAMARTQARWHHLRGETEAAGLIAAAADAVEHDPTGAPLMAVLADRTRRSLLPPERDTPRADAGKPEHGKEGRSKRRRYPHPRRPGNTAGPGRNAPTSALEVASALATR